MVEVTVGLAVLDVDRGDKDEDGDEDEDGDVDNDAEGLTVVRVVGPTVVLVAEPSVELVEPAEAASRPNVVDCRCSSARVWSAADSGGCHRVVAPTIKAIVSAAADKTVR